jgi:hypothetical protein
MKAFRDYDSRTKLKVYAAVGAICLVAIAWFAFFIVTLTKAFQASTAWETLAIYLLIIFSGAILWRMLGLHEMR